jgi:predicted MFS family arabinose efflux permease
VWQAARFVARNPAVGGAFLCDLLATTLAMPIALFPVINDERFGGAPQTLGLFMTALGAGGLVASVGSGAVTRSRHPGRILLTASAVWGLALASVGVVHSLPVALLLVAAAGAADMIAVITRGTIVQLGTPDSYRGRVSAMEHVIGAAGPHVGNLRAGLVAGASSVGVAFVAGGALCVVAIGLLAALVPSLRRLDLAASAPVTARTPA